MGAPDYMIKHLELFDEYVETGVNPMTVILNYLDEHHLEDDALQAEKMETAETVGKFFLADERAADCI
jgi:hypothetical protein